MGGAAPRKAALDPTGLRAVISGADRSWLAELSVARRTRAMIFARESNP